MQKPFVVCRLFNNEEKSKKGGSAKSKPALAPLSPASEVQVETLQTSIQSCYSEIYDEMMSDVTLPVQSNNNNNYHNADIAKCQAAELTYSEVIGTLFVIRHIPFFLFAKFSRIF